MAGSRQTMQKTAAAVYPSVIANTLFYAVVCWGRNIRRRDADRLIKRVDSMVRMELESFVVVAERRALEKLLANSDDVCHLLHTTIAAQRSFSSSRQLSLSFSETDMQCLSYPSPCTITNCSFREELMICDQVAWCICIYVYMESIIHIISACKLSVYFLWDLNIFIFLCICPDFYVR